VHHKNGRRADNRVDNLCVCSREEHSSIHASMELLVYELLEGGMVEFCGTDGYYMKGGE